MSSLTASTEWFVRTYVMNAPRHASFGTRVFRLCVGGGKKRLKARFLTHPSPLRRQWRPSMSEQLAMSRALGDYQYKDNVELGPDEQMVRAP